MLGLHFRRSQIIDGFVADFYCHAAGLVIEVDGPIHEQQREYDAARDRILAAHNLRILRVTNEEVLRALPDVLARIVAIIEQTVPGRPLPRPLSASERGAWFDRTG